jgi:hypothetical protein
MPARRHEVLAESQYQEVVDHLSGLPCPSQPKCESGSFTFERVELDAQKSPAYIVTPVQGCGSGGCNQVLYLRSRGRWLLLAEVFGVIEVAPEQFLEMHDLILSDDDVTRFRWDGSRYVPAVGNQIGAPGPSSARSPGTEPLPLALSVGDPALANCPMAQSVSTSALLNPILESEEHIRQEQRRYERVYMCIVGVARIRRLSVEAEALRQNLETFLAFVGLSQHSSLQTVDDPDARSLLHAMRAPRRLVRLEFANDDAVRKLRNSTQMAAPRGLVFVRVYGHGDEMPDLVRRAFNDVRVQGVTFACRFVALRGGNEEVQAKTLSHELIHAYVSSTIGPRAGTLPEWFHEGVAIYFSGQMGTRYTELRARGGSVVAVGTSEIHEYQNYRRVFEYAEGALGKQELWSQIRLAIESGSSDKLLQKLGLSSYDEVLAAASMEESMKTGLLYAVIILAGVLIVAFGVSRQSKETDLPVDGT